MLEEIRKHWKLALVVWTIIWGVAIAVVVAMILYEPLPEEIEWCCDDPCMMLTHHDEGGGRWEITVASTTEARDLDLFEARLLRNGSVVASMEPLSTNAAGELSFIDLNGDGKLTIGDHFTVQCEPGTYDLFIMWREGDCAKAGTDWEA